MTKPVDPATPVVDPPERLVRMIPEMDRKMIQREIQGLMAKLRWEHMAEPLKDTWRVRIAELKERLKDA